MKNLSSPLNAVTLLLKNNYFYHSFLTKKSVGGERNDLKEEWQERMEKRRGEERNYGTDGRMRGEEKEQKG